VRTVSIPVSAGLRWPAYAVALTSFFLLLLVHGGPNPAEIDAIAVTHPTTAISQGQFRVAQQETFAADPPGYPLFVAPLVIAFHPWFGAPRWCDDRAIPAILRRGPGISFYDSLLAPCNDKSVVDRLHLPPWYRSQAALTLIGWIFLASGTVLLLRAFRGGKDLEELLLVFAIAMLPTACDAIIQSFHPQDLMCVGLISAGLSQVLRQRWVLVGVLFGCAVLCKQFAVLPLFAVLVVAPDWRGRVQIASSTMLTVCLAMLPFLVAAPTATERAVTGTYVAGVGIIKTATALGLMSIPESHKLQLARGLPILASGVTVSWAWWRYRRRLFNPVSLTGLSLACLATRLVFEVSIFAYYLLAVSVFLLLLDFSVGRPPLWSAGWILFARYGLIGLGGNWPSAAFAAGIFLAAIVPLVLAIRHTVESSQSPSLFGARRVGELWLPQQRCDLRERVELEPPLLPHETARYSCAIPAGCPTFTT
jgi:hypothetical protein